MGFTKVVDFPTSIVNNNVDKSISIYPNPVSNQLMISFSKDVKVNSMKAIDISGRIVLAQELNQQDFIQINTKEFSKGKYFLIFESEQGEISKSFIKN